jgi:hypothetical protein
MAILGIYWVSLVRMLDGKRAEFFALPAIKGYQQRLGDLLAGKTQASLEQYKEALKEQQGMVEWERGYYQSLRTSIVGLGWIGIGIALSQLTAIYYIYKRVRKHDSGAARA